MKKLRLATVWLDGCAGCHMSLLDMDESILAVAGKADILYGPLVDAQEFPDDVDVTLVEGAVSSQEDVHKIRTIRQRTRTLVSLGDCAITGNVPAMRNSIPVNRLLQSIYVDGVQEACGVPVDEVPPLVKQARPVRDYVRVDLYLPGCPPSAQAILGILTDVLDGRKPELKGDVKFG